MVAAAESHLRSRPRLCTVAMMVDLPDVGARALGLNSLWRPADSWACPYQLPFGTDERQPLRRIREQAMVSSAIRSDPPSTRAAGPSRLCINLPATAGQVAEARRFVASFVDDPTLVGDAVLCVSELAANAVSHSDSRFAGGRFTVAAERDGDGRFRIQVLDQGGRWIKRARAGHVHLGLIIVSRIASAWGIHSDDPGGRTVWFELGPDQAWAMSAA
jgi:anti-sigma regulatory factor (Ser/Thr protein kinase)